MPVKRKIYGGFLSVLGFMLSPLSWWNDAFVNLPLAVGYLLLTLPLSALARFLEESGWGDYRMVVAEDLGLETERLILRDWREEDWPVFLEGTNTPAVMRWLGGVPVERSASHNVVDQTGDLDNARGHADIYYFGGKKLRLLGPASMDGTEIWVTTCDRDPPHYRIRIREAAIREGKSS